MNIGLTIKEIRIRKKISQKDLASLANISPSYLSQLESGSRNPSVEILESIGNTLGVPYQVISFMSLDSDSIPDEKKTHYEHMKPVISNIVDDLFFSS